jgi:hypothetical protein
LRFVNAPSTGGTVRLDYLTNPYWAKRFDGIRRVAAPKTAPTPFDGPTYLASPGNAAPATAAVDRSASPDRPDRLEPLAVQPPARARAPAASADQFEPPPSSLTAAQRQSRMAGAAAPDAQPQSAPAADPFEPPPSALTAAQRQARAAGAVSPSPSSAPDPIEAAADAFEPPPPSARLAAQQARAARQTPVEPPAHVMRASTGTLVAPRPDALPSDDPIARFATGRD